MVELGKKWARDIRAHRRNKRKRGRELEHVPENRMMMIQYFPVRGHSVRQSATKSPFSISAALSFSPAHAEIHLHPLTLRRINISQKHTLSTWALYFCLTACVENHLLSKDKSRPSFLTQPVNEYRAAHPLNLSTCHPFLPPSFHLWGAPYSSLPSQHHLQPVFLLFFLYPQGIWYVL